jgi:hypothetical protein
VHHYWTCDHLKILILQTLSVGRSFHLQFLSSIFCSFHF